MPLHMLRFLACIRFITAYAVLRGFPLFLHTSCSCSGHAKRVLCEHVHDALFYIILSAVSDLRVLRFEGITRNLSEYITIDNRGVNMLQKDTAFEAYAFICGW